MSDKRHVLGNKRWAVAWLLIVFLVLGVTYTAVTPIFEASDELWHYPVVQYIASGHGLPVQTPPDQYRLWKQEASQPPLYYTLAALLTSWIDTNDLTATLRPNPHAAIGVVTPDGNINMVAHDPAREAWPWRGTVLAVHIVRLLSVALGAVTVYLTYRLGLATFPDRPEIALGAAALVAFTPMFTFLSSSVNNDNLATPLCALALLIMIRQGQTASGNERRLMLGWLVLGVVIGLATLSKASGIALLPLAALTGVWVAWQRSHRQPPPQPSPHEAEGTRSLAFAGRGSGERVSMTRLDWHHLFAAGLAIGLSVLALTGWWFWRNLRLYGDLLGFKMFTPYFTRPVPADLAQIWSERTSFLYGYWGNFGGLNLPIPAWAYALLNGVLLLAGIGLITALVRLALIRARAAASAVQDQNSKRFARNPKFPILLIALWGLIVFVGWLTWTRTTWSSQGRLVFYALPAYSIWIVAGLAAWLPRRILPFILGALGMGLALFSAAMPFTVIAPAYARPPQLTAAQIAHIPQRVDVTFGDALVLLGYDAPSVSVQPGNSISITLYWQAIKPMDRNYNVFLHLLDENDLEAQDKGPAYPGRGNLPTTTLTPGQTWAETWVVPLRFTAYAPARLTWEVGLCDACTTDDPRLPAVDKSGRALSDNVRFGKIALMRPAGSLFNPISYNFGDQIELIGYDLDRRAARPGETVNLTLYWRALAAPARDYTVFVHVLGPQQTKVAARDAQPTPPTSRWKTGQVVSSTYPLTFDAAAPSGVFDTEVGVYYFTGESNFERLKIITTGGQLQEDFVLLSRVRVSK